MLGSSLDHGEVVIPFDGAIQPTRKDAPHTLVGDGHCDGLSFADTGSPDELDHLAQRICVREGLS